MFRKLLFQVLTGICLANVAHIALAAETKCHCTDCGCKTCDCKDCPGDEGCQHKDC